MGSALGIEQTDDIPIGSKWKSIELVADKVDEKPASRQRNIEQIEQKLLNISLESSQRMADILKRSI